MKKATVFARLVVIFFLGYGFFSPPALLAGKIELTTYYPAPYGEYTELKATGNDTDNTRLALEARGSSGTGLVVTNANRVGIGTIPSIYPLEIKSYWAVLGINAAGEGEDFDSGIRLLKNNDVKWHIFNNGNGPDLLHFISASNQGVTITQAGNVGIGTTTPAAKLSVAGTIKSTTHAQNVQTTKTILKTYHSTCGNDPGFSTGFALLTCNSACSKFCRNVHGYSGGTLVEWQGGTDVAICDCIP